MKKTVNRICWTCKHIGNYKDSGYTCDIDNPMDEAIDEAGTCDKWDLANYILCDVVE